MQKESVRDMILEELASGPKIWSQLLDAVREVRSISQSAFYYHLTKLLQDGKIRKIVRPDGLKNYELAETEKAPAEVAPKVAEIEVADEEEISFLLNVIRQAHTDKARKQAFTDLKIIINTKDVTLYPEIWGFFRDKLDDKNYERYWPELIECLRFILKNARASNDKETINLLKNDLFPRILRIAKTPTRARWQGVEFIDDLLSNDEKFKELKEIAEKVIEQGDDVTYLYPLAKMYTQRKKEIWRWLYSLIDSDDQKVREKASDLLSYLRDVAGRK